jgi:short-subunit dehydrogenase
VVGVSRRESSVEATKYEHHVMDVREPEYGKRLNRIISATRVDACVYCAGIGQRFDLEDLAAERAVFETNLIGAVVTAEEVIPAMVRAEKGQFLALSSQADGLVNPTAPSYSASKAALSSYLEGLAPACRRKGVYVTNVRFGFVDTKMAKGGFRPFMISATEAASRIRGCMRRNPVRYTFPKLMAALLLCVRLASAVRRRFQ